MRSAVGIPCLQAGEDVNADGCRTVSRQPLEIVHHLHLIVILPPCVGGPPGWDSDLVARSDVGGPEKHR